MILGHVRDRFPRVVLAVQGREETVQVEFVVDTGYDGELSIPPAIMARLYAVFRGERIALMADRTPRQNAYFDVLVEWDGEIRTAEALLMDGRPLLGYDMMEGLCLDVEMVDGGEVRIEEL